MKTTLIIIGNGFDLLHGIKSKYTDFAGFFCEVDEDNYIAFSNHLFYQRDIAAETAEMKGYYVEPQNFPEDFDNWSDLENQLSTLSPDYFGKKGEEFACNYASDDYSDGDRYHYASWFAEDFAKDLYGAVEKIFRSWVGTLNENLDSIAPIQWMKKLSDSLETIFLSFNYTETLEKIYNVDANQILHIHGSLQSKEPLILGHGKDSDLCEQAFYEIFYPQTNDNHIESEEDYIEGDIHEVPEHLDIALGEVKQYFADRKKDTDKCIEENSIFFRSMNNIQDVYIIGHSLNSVDLPYFEKIKQEILPSAIWHVYFYANDEKDNFRDILQNQLNIKQDNIILDQYP